MIIFKNGNKKDLNIYSSLCLQSNIYTVLTEVLNKRLEKTFNKKPATKASCIQKQTLNNRSHSRRNPTEGEMPKTYSIHRIHRIREILRLSVMSSNTDFGSRTEDRTCVHRTPEGYLHQQLIDRPRTQRKQQVKHQERSTTGRYHIAQTVYTNTCEHIVTTDLGNQRRIF